MAHYVFLDENNIVTEVIVGKNENDPVPNGFDSWEAYYGNVKGQTCKRTSYNTLRNAHSLGFYDKYNKLDYTFSCVISLIV